MANGHFTFNATKLETVTIYIMPQYCCIHAPGPHEHIIKTMPITHDSHWHE